MRSRIILLLFPLFSLVSVVYSNAECVEGISIFPQPKIEEPKYPGGMSACLNFIAKNIKYPREALMTGKQGKVVLNLVIDTDGAIVDVSVAKSVNPELDEEAMRVAYLMPNWIPGKKDGKPIRVRHQLPVNFKLAPGVEAHFLGDGVKSIEEIARYPGGIFACMKFLVENMKYPEAALKERIQGKVLLILDIDEEGSIKNVDVSISVSPELDAEAIRLARLMPQWIPGKKGGKPIRSKYLIPVDFRLDEDMKDK